MRIYGVNGENFKIRFLKKVTTDEEKVEIARAIIERDYIIKFLRVDFHLTYLHKIAEVTVDL